MFNGQAESLFPKLPTFMQYCNKHPFEAEKGVKVVVFIWLPNQYDSITLDTESFRLRISSKADFYEALLRQLSDWEEKEAVPILRISSAKDYAYILDELPGEKATWEHVGEFGRRLVVRDKPKRRAGRVSQNPSSLKRDASSATSIDGPEEAQEG